MLNKSVYVKVLEILNQSLSAIQRYNKLVSVQVATEDQELIRLINECLKANTTV